MCSYHVFSESIICSCLNVNKLLARNRRAIWVLSDCRGIPMHNYLVRKQTLKTIWPVWVNGWVFVYKLSGCGFESLCSHSNFRYCVCFKQGVLWNSGKYIHRLTLKRLCDMIRTPILTILGPCKEMLDLTNLLNFFRYVALFDAKTLLLLLRNSELTWAKSIKLISCCNEDWLALNSFFKTLLFSNSCVKQK